MNKETTIDDIATVEPKCSLYWYETKSSRENKTIPPLASPSFGWIETTS